MSVSAIGLADSAAATRYRLGLLLVTLSAVAWSTAGFFTHLIPLDAWTILFWRGIFGALTGLVFIVATDRGKTWRAFAGMSRAGMLFSLMSVVGMVTFIVALKLTTVAHVAIIYATVPLVSAAVAWIALGERASSGALVASLLALGGVAITVLNGFGEGDAVGDALAFVMVFSMSVLIVLVRRAKLAIPMVPAACLSAVLGTLVSLPFAAPLSASPADLVYLALFGLTNMAFGLICFTIGARFIPAAQTALIGSLDAPLAPIWVWLAFGETPKATTIIGGTIVVAAVVGHSIYENRKLRGSAL